MKTTKKIVALFSAALITSAIFAQNSKLQSDIEKGIEYHNMARAEGLEYAQKACDILKPYTDENAVACAVYGSSQTIIAGFVAEKNPIKSLEYLQTGGEYLDKAVKIAPDDFFTHMIHLENGIEVSRSSPIKRYSAIRSDVEWFLDDENILKGDSENQAEAYLYCGYFKLEEGDLDYALELLENCVSVCPKSEYAKQANKLLDRYTE